MKRSLSLLLERASASLPPQRPSRATWSPFVPVVRQLQTNGYDVLGAVDWLIGEGEIRAADRARAYRALLAVLKDKAPCAHTMKDQFVAPRSTRRRDRPE